MSKANINITQVAISVVKLGSIKMTQSIFKQVLVTQYFDIDNNKRGQILGYVNKEGIWLLWIYKGELRKTILPIINKVKIQTGDQVLVSDCQDILSKLSKVFAKRVYHEPLPNWINQPYMDSNEWTCPEECDMYIHFRSEILNDQQQIFI